MSVACEEGEKICYGAWIEGDQNTYWGAGPNNPQECEDCCYVCTGGQTEEINWCRRQNAVPRPRGCGGEVPSVGEGR